MKDSYSAILIIFTTYLNGHFGGTFGNENPRKVRFSCSLSETNSLKRFEHIKVPAITMSYACNEIETNAKYSNQFERFLWSHLIQLTKFRNETYNISVSIFVFDM